LAAGAGLESKTARRLRIAIARIRHRIESAILEALRDAGQRTDVAGRGRRLGVEPPAAHGRQRSQGCGHSCELAASDFSHRSFPPPEFPGSIQREPAALKACEQNDPWRPPLAGHAILSRRTGSETRSTPPAAPCAATSVGLSALAVAGPVREQPRPSHPTAQSP